MNRFPRLLIGLAVGLSLGAAAQAGPRLDTIMAQKVLRVGTPGDYRPFAMKTGEGRYEGYDIDVIEQMAGALGVKVEYVQTSWPNLMADLQADRFDVAVGGITRTPARIAKVNMLPGYAPFGKVALVRKDQAQQYQSAADLNQPTVKVIKNPGGTNEAYVLANLGQAQIATHDKNAEIPGLIAEGKGDVMITETYEALHYSKADPRLAALFIDTPLTPKSWLGFMVPTDDADYLRVMDYAWDLVDQRGGLAAAEQKWLQ